MELTKQALLQAIEDMGRIYMDFMGAYYGTRSVEVPVPEQNPLAMPGQETQERVVVPFEFDALSTIPCSVELDVGASSYWSEIASMQTLDNLLMNRHISVVDYLKRLPAGQIADRDGLIAALQQREALAAAEAMQVQAPGAAPADMAGPALTQGVPSPEGGGYGTLQRKINETGEIPKER